MSCPVLIVRGNDNPLIGEEQANAIRHALAVGSELEDQPGIRQCLEQGEGCVLIDVDVSAPRLYLVVA